MSKISKSKFFIILSLAVILNLYLVSFSENVKSIDIPQDKYPDYSSIYLGYDKFENFNRKIFIMNSKLNKFFIRPVNIVWSSIIPRYGMDRIQNAAHNIEYPKRLVSCLLQKDFKSSKTESIRFITNTTIGLGGLYDPAKNLFNIKPVQEDIDQALHKCKIKSGPYIVLPFFSSSSVRGTCSKAIEAALDPSVYIGCPITTLVKMGLLVNKTSSMQPLIHTIETNYYDPYDIAKKLYGVESYIKIYNLDRQDVLDKNIKEYDKLFVNNQSGKEKNLLSTDIDLSFDKNNNITSDIHNQNSIYSYLDKELTPDNIVLDDFSYQNFNIDKNKKFKFGKVSINKVIQGNATAHIDEKSTILKNIKLIPDITLENYYPQFPVVDSMRTSLFDDPEIFKSAWSELSIWNRSFFKKIKTSSINIYPERDNYKFRYILQKDPKSPLAIFYPSIGEGVNSHHTNVFAKLLYDQGYSVIIQGSHFHWEFVKSMPSGYKPGIPSQDSEQLRLLTLKIIDKIEKKYKYNFSQKILVGTSFGALNTLFVAKKESENNTLDIDKFISINPPIELVYAMSKLDKNSEQWDRNSENLKKKIAICAAKILQLLEMKESSDDFQIKTFPFTEEEGMLITGFVLHQKLTDLVCHIENIPLSKKSQEYKYINNMNYQDYFRKYLLNDKLSDLKKLNYDTSLHSIANYLKHNNNYKIYHTLDDYFTDLNQLKALKSYSKNKLVLIDHGSHLGFLYRQEFLDSFKNDVAQVLKQNI